MCYNLRVINNYKERGSHMTKYEMYVLINRMLEELEEKEVARVYEYTQRIWINSTDEKSD
jgi:hypothetical protein